jgi:membrane-anchored protein YejM (alkaline phosphatase superfamily)
MILQNIGLPSFLRLEIIQLCVYICMLVCVSVCVCIIQSSVKKHLAFFHVFDILNNTAMKIKRYLLDIMMSFPLDIYLNVALLDHMEVLFLIFYILSYFFFTFIFSPEPLPRALCMIVKCSIAELHTKVLF